MTAGDPPACTEHEWGRWEPALAPYDLMALVGGYYRYRRQCVTCHAAEFAEDLAPVGRIRRTS